LGLGAGSVNLHYTGSAGQSFGAFIVPGMRMQLEGEANDYVGKGMCGGEIAIRPCATSTFATPQVIAGNTLMYGASGGEVYIAGRAGERFMVRNSGAIAVVEGVGDHGCEYMTGGMAVVLGPTGRNFGAGMTNGVAWVYDPEGVFPGRINGESVLLESVGADSDTTELRARIERHVAHTGSAHARALLENWDEARTKFWQVIPRAAVAARVEEAAAEAATPGAAD